MAQPVDRSTSAPKKPPTIDVGDASANVVVLRPATFADWPLIRSWLARPEIQNWWGPLTQCEGAVIAALRSDGAIARMIELNGWQVGYAHAAEATLWGDDLPDNLPAGTWDLDLFIAEPSARGRGIGPEALKQLKTEVFATTLAVAACVFPSISNESAVRAFEKAGFAWQSVWDDPRSGPSWFMIAER